MSGFRGAPDSMERGRRGAAGRVRFVGWDAILTAADYVLRVPTAERSIVVAPRPIRSRGGRAS